MALDPHLSYRSLLLHFDGSNGSTTFTDSSTHAHACTAVGNAQLTTANSVFGGASLLLDGSGDSCSIAYSSALNLAGSDWTVQGRSRATTNAGQWGIIEFGGTGGTSGFLIYRGDDDRKLLVFDWATSELLAQTAENVLPVANTWFSWAVTMAGTTIRIFVDGVLSATETGVTTPATSTDGVAIGRILGASGTWNGQHDEVRILKGVAAYTATYTPEASAFDDDAGGFVRAPAILTDPSLVGAIDVTARASAGSPLSSSTALLCSVLTAGWAADPGPLRQPSIRSVLVSGVASDSSVLRQPSILAITTFAHASAPSVLAAPLVIGHHDITALIDTSAGHAYVMELATPTGPVLVPISSWQSTLTTVDQCYSQCVIPAVTQWLATLETATDFVVYRTARLLTGEACSVPVTFAPIQTVTIDQGSRRHTATLSGYTAAYPTYSSPPLDVRPLQGLHLVSSANGRLRAQCAIDWILRPGHTASINGDDIEVSYINYYCTDGSESMMVGEV